MVRHSNSFIFNLVIYYILMYYCTQYEIIPYSLSVKLSVLCTVIKQRVCKNYVGLFLCMHFNCRQAIFVDTFIFLSNQTELVREQHFCCSLHESLDGIVITDHRLILQ